MNIKAYKLLYFCQQLETLFIKTRTEHPDFHLLYCLLVCFSFVYVLSIASHIIKLSKDLELMFEMLVPVEAFSFFDSRKRVFI